LLRLRSVNLLFNKRICVCVVHVLSVFIKLRNTKVLCILILLLIGSCSVIVIHILNKFSFLLPEVKLSFGRKLRRKLFDLLQIKTKMFLDSPFIARCILEVERSKVKFKNAKSL